MGLRVNPGAPELWSQNAIVSGRSTSHHLEPMAGTLSIKTTLDGCATWRTEQGRYDVSPETCLVLNQGQTYGLDVEATSPVETFCIFFKPGFLEDAAGQSFGFYERMRLTPTEIATPLRKLRSLLSEGACAGLEADEAMVELAHGLLVAESAPRERASLAHANASTREEVFRQLNRARDFALSHLHARVALDELALVACMSPFHFHRLHRQAFGESPHEFITRARIQRAARLLRSGATVGDVSVELGFESLPTFTRLFKSRVGMTPGAFRKIG
jgi:AraC family transcriptional regulator